MSFLTIRNLRNENLILKSIRTDLYQVTVFYFRGKDSNNPYNIKNIYPKALIPGESMGFQIIILPDTFGEIKGNIYIELSDNRVIIYPISIIGIANIYKVQPVYFPNWQSSRLLNTPITIYNSFNRTLIIKEVLNSFNHINVVWPNGQSVSSNYTSISTSMLEIPPFSSKNIVLVNFYKEVSGIEYGLLQMKTDKDILIIPVLIKVEIQGLKLFPNYFDFGIIDINSKIQKAIPISVSNFNKVSIQIKGIFSLYEENMLEFIVHPHNHICSMNTNNLNVDFLGELESNNYYNPDLCVMQPLETIHNFGYVMINPSNYFPEINGSNLYKKMSGILILQTNYTENPYIELNYSYYLDKNTFNCDSKKFEFLVDPKLKNQFFNITTRINPSFNYLSALEHPYIQQIEVNIEDSGLNENDLDERKLTLKFEIKNITMSNNKKYYYLPVKTSNLMTAIVPIKIYENTLKYIFCDNQQKYKFCMSNLPYSIERINEKNNKLTIDFGIVSIDDISKKYFIIINDNSEDSEIKDISLSAARIVLGIETIENLEYKEFENRYKNEWNNQKLQKLLKRKFDSDDEAVNINL